MFLNQNQVNGTDGPAGNICAGNPGASTPADYNNQQTAGLNGILLNQQQPSNQPQQQISTAGQQQQLTNLKNARKKPYVKIIEQPASKALRFRYECEGRSAGSIPGANSTPENKTYPTIEIVGYKGRAVVVVSCVTKEAPYRPHPHNLVGKEGCKKGVCTIEINSGNMRAVFSNLGIQCVKKKDIGAALKAREDIRVDPFKTGSSIKNLNIDLNVVRLCFQVFLEGDQKGRFTQPIAPIVSDPIYDKKAMSDLVICRLCSCSSTVAGGATIILLCEKVSKEDISVKFFQDKNGTENWSAFGEFQQTDVHKQTAITFKTPPYHTLDIDKPAQVFVQLFRPSDKATSDPLPFDYLPLESDSASLKRKRQKTGGDPMNFMRLFQEIQQQQQQSPQQLQQSSVTQTQDGPVLLTNMNWNIPAIKTEPGDVSPQSFALYRNLPEHTPSPQPASPSNPYNNPNGAASPFSVVTGSGNGNVMMSPNHSYGSGGNAGIISSPNDTHMTNLTDYVGYQQTQQSHQQQHFQNQTNTANLFLGGGGNINAMGPSWSPPNQMMDTIPPQHSNNLTTNTYNVNNLLPSTASRTADIPRELNNTNNLTMLGNNNLQQLQNFNLNAMIVNTQNQAQSQLQPHQLLQQMQQNSTNNIGNTESGPTISNLFNLDSDQLMSLNMNSEDLQISNLSIST